MEWLLDFFTTVGTNVASYFLIKAIDKYLDNGGNAKTIASQVDATPK